MNTCKFTQFGFNVQDGKRPAEELSQSQRQYSIKEVPDFFSYFSFVSFFGSCIYGPTFEFNDFLKYIHKTGEYERAPFSGAETARQILQFVVLSIVYFGGSMVVPIKSLIEPQFAQNAYLYKFLYLYLATTIYRMKYHAGKVSFCLSCTN